MPWSELDTAAVARALSQIAEQPEDVVDAYFERREEVELPPEEDAPGLRVWREEGFAVRLLRGRRSWLASRDGIAERPFAEALRQVARALPSVGYPEPQVRATPPAGREDGVRELRDFPAAVSRAIRAHHVGIAARLTLRRHRRWLQVVGPRLVAESQTESFYSCVVESSWGRCGALLPRLDAAAADEVAAAVVALFRARHAAPPASLHGVVVLAPAAVAVLLHEAVAHALEADTLARGGRPEAALGLALGAPCLDVLDDPSAAPPEVRRTSDDEGLPVCRRWLLRRGAVEQPLADAAWSRIAPTLLPGAGRRGSRHLPPGPRSTHLELLAGAASESDLLAQANGGLFLPAASRGGLDPLSGEFTLHLPHGRRIRRGALGEPVGACALRGQVADLLARAAAVGRESVPAGAGWCAKGGQKLPVWATAPALRLEGVTVEADG
ncbi:MAG TPA: metallopeptidase TldD-related protein [Thermoanaerobaculia bacterium]|jgi:predicted Zn-dependent protease|nr:metallopeptidase TldD-related protein [Thermoanaerobaculia bacterium]